MAEMRIDLLADELAKAGPPHVSPLASTVSALVAERDRLVAVNAELTKDALRYRKARELVRLGGDDDDLWYQIEINWSRQHGDFNNPKSDAEALDSAIDDELAKSAP